MLQLQRVSKLFGSFAALQNVDFAVQSGEIVGLLGENGAGKSTLLNIVGGAFSPSSGAISWREQSVEMTSPRDASRLGIGVVHQHPQLVEAFSVAENLALAAGSSSTSSTRSALYRAREWENRVEAWARELGWNVPAKARVETLSVGQRQRVEILKALFAQGEIAQLLLLDEPTANLTPSEADELFGMMRRLKTQGRGLVFVSHKLREVLEICDRVVVLRRGQIVGERIANQTNADELAQLMIGDATPSKAQRAETQRTEAQRAETQRADLQFNKMQRDTAQREELQRNETQRNELQRNELQDDKAQRADLQPENVTETARDFYLPRANAHAETSRNETPNAQTPNAQTPNAQTPNAQTPSANDENRARVVAANFATAQTTPNSSLNSAVNATSSTRSFTDASPLGLEIQSLNCGQLRDFSLQVREGEIVGIAGVDGNGQSELVECLAGLTTYKGAIQSVGEIAVIPPDRERSGLIADFSLAENVALHPRARQKFGSFARFDWRGARTLTREMMTRFDVRAPQTQERSFARQLSGGNQQKLLIARALEFGCGVVVAADPTRGLDIGASRFVHSQLKNAAQDGAAVLLISTDLDEVLALSNRVFVLYEGRLSPQNGLSPDDSREEIGRLMGGRL